MFAVLEPYMIWIRLATYALVFAAGCWATHRYYLGEEAGVNLEIIDAQHEAALAARDRETARGERRLKVERETSAARLALAKRAASLRNEVVHVPLVPVATCVDDPRGPEWLRLYNAPVAPTVRPADGPAERVPQ